MELRRIFQEINFTNRYEKICESSVEFEKIMSGNNVSLYKEVFDLLEIKYKYNSNGSFFSITDKKEDIALNLHLVLKGGIIETFLFIKENGVQKKGIDRFDFIPEELNLPFNREKYNLPRYSSKQELISMLSQIFNIYNDLKEKILNY